MKKERFKERLKKLNINQKEFAKLIGYSYSAVKGWDETPIWVNYVLNYFEIEKNVDNMEEIICLLQSLTNKFKK